MNYHYICFSFNKLQRKASKYNTLLSNIEVENSKCEKYLRVRADVKLSKIFIIFVEKRDKEASN